jgi:hypothetical protein
MGPTQSTEGDRMFNFMINHLLINNPEYIMGEAIKEWSRKTWLSKMKSKYIFIETDNFIKNQLYFNVQYFHCVFYDRKINDDHYNFNICNSKTLEIEMNHYLGHDPTRGYKMYKVIKKNRWVKIKCIVIALSLHKRAVVTANHPLRLLERGDFNKSD